MTYHSDKVTDKIDRFLVPETGRIFMIQAFSMMARRGEDTSAPLLR